MNSFLVSALANIGSRSGKKLQLTVNSMMIDAFFLVLSTTHPPFSLHLTIDEMHKKYGNIFRIRIESIDAVFLSSADSMRSIFAYEGKYPKHPLPPSWLYYNEKFNVQRGLFFM
jgi:hypothetical protein